MTLDPTQPEDPRIGTTIADRYEVESIAGRGGMSVVYKARDTLLGRTVAIKTLSMGAASPDDARRQQDEVAVLARLIHPSLVVLFDALDNGSGGLVLVMEYVDGRSMHEAIADGSSRTLDVARLGGELASALAYVHAQGIVHRDIKPGNVLLPVPSEHGAMAKLADFGIARLVDSNGITGTGLTVGTPAYLSPEQVTGEPAGPKSDVYGLGLVLIEAISGTRAFEGT
ncbi:MAG: eukaryotic-like serine/threonine-protein kinase, partial [Actinomycetota bacterium]|nr:eukaryotic-like serine/threonine-protein kinase [Actinomycetota bacterium]